jgi:excisionase family DNA binding protein
MKNAMLGSSLTAGNGKAGDQNQVGDGAPPAPMTQSGGKPPGLSPGLLDCRMAFSVKEVAVILGISEKTVRRLIRRGLIHASRALRHHLIPKKEIEKFLDRTAAQ